MRAACKPSALAEPPKPAPETDSQLDFASLQPARSLPLHTIRLPPPRDPCDKEMKSILSQHATASLPLCATPLPDSKAQVYCRRCCSGPRALWVCCAPARAWKTRPHAQTRDGHSLPAAQNGLPSQPQVGQISEHESQFTKMEYCRAGGSAVDG